MGATSGLGKGVALGLLQEGYTIGIAGRRNEELEKIKALAPDKVFSKVIDVTADDALLASVKQRLIGNTKSSVSSGVCSPLIYGKGCE